MKKTTLTIYLLFISAIGMISFSVINTDSPHSVMKSMGGPPYNTNAPGEKTCSGIEGASPCHSGGIPDNTGPATCSIISSGGTMYVPGQTYTITPTITHATRMRFGFQLTARRASNNANTGNLTVPIADTANMWTQFPGYGSCQTCEFIMHKKVATYFLSTTGSWSFTWTAPSSNVGNIKMYACFNAANNDNAETGDEIYYTTLTLTPSATGVNEQNIFASSITISPNPAQDFFNLKMDLEEQGKISADLYSVDGKLIRKCFEKYVYSGKFNEKIVLNQIIPQGIYFLKISTGEKIAVKKIILMQ